MRLKAAIVAIMLSGLCFGQESEIKRIRNVFTETNKKIEDNQATGSKYCIEIIKDRIVPGVGPQITSTKLFFHENYEDYLKSSKILLKAVVTYNVAQSLSVYEEYLFENNKVIFYYEKLKGYTCGEKRFYFKNNKLIKLKSNPISCEYFEELLEDYEKNSNFSEYELEEANRIMEEGKIKAELFNILSLE